MWSDILLSLVTAVADATYSNIINKKKVEKFNGKLFSIIDSLFNEFADSSLDNNQFAQIIKSKPFVEMLRNYFFSIRDGLTHSEYMNRFETYICKADTKLKSYEVRSFINKFDELYTTYLHKVIEENIELNALMQILTQSHRELLTKIVESEENLYKYIQSLDKSAIQITNKDILLYHENCRNEFDKIRFTGISGAEDRAIQDLEDFYVENSFSYYSKKFIEIYDYVSKKEEELHLSNFFDYGNKIVLIGAAGLGKSTTLNYLFCNYEKIYHAKALKLKIDLKDYAKEIVENKKDIVWCLSKEFYKRIKRTKMQFDEVESIIGAFLDRGECLVILDALDEIPTQAMRNTVRNEISNFCELYYLNRFIISTREVGYLRNKFDDSFLHIKINEFNEEQIKKYSRNWVITNYKQYEFDDFWHKFNIEVQRSKCNNLIKNPIVLILALVIFDIEKNLPNRRVSFYKKCIETFLIVREDRKASFKMTEKTKSILGDDLVIPKIAHYKYECVNEDAGYKFSLEEVKNAIMEAIEVTDKINWREPVNQYTGYLINRTELLGEIDEDRYDFAHKTFYEYFLAIYYSKELENKELVNLLSTWIGDANNDELARLIIEVVIEKNDPRKHKYIVDFMFQQIDVEWEKTRDEISKAVDIFSIIADLYRNNMLLPKFHEQYYKCILYHSKIVIMAERQRFRLQDESNIKVEFDVNILAQRFIEEISDDKHFNSIIDSIYHLNGRFRYRVVQKTKDERIKHIANLFTWLQNSIHATGRKESQDVIENEVNYFMRNQIDLTLSCPQIYIAISDFVILDNRYELIPQLLNCKFEALNVFYSYTNPRILYRLVDLAFDSPDNFLFFMQLIIRCAKTSTNRLIVYILRNHIQQVRDKIRPVDICQNAIVFWKMLNGSEKMGEFKEWMLKFSIYNEKYDCIYKDLFIEYKMVEQSLNKDRISAVIDHYEEISKETMKKSVNKILL